MPSIFGVAKVALWSLSPFGILCTWGLIERNGYFPALRRIRTHGPFVLPGSSTPIKRTYTGIQPLDFHLRVLQAFFANVVDGSAPHLSLFAFQFSGTLLAFVAIMCIEGLKGQNKGRLVSVFALWGWAMQAFGYDAIAPAWCALHLSTVPYAHEHEEPSASVLPVSLAGLTTLPWSLTVGYILPIVLMCVPGLSTGTHQAFVALWQGFPLWIIICQYMFRLLLRGDPADTSRQGRIGQRTLTKYGLRTAYSFAFAGAAFTHLVTMSLVATPLLFPVLFSAATVEGFHPVHVFVPPPFWSSTPVDMIEGVLHFLQYDQYVGSLGVLLWASVVSINTRRYATGRASWTRVLLKVVILTAFVGPGAAALALLWERDETLLDIQPETEADKRD